MTVRKRIFITVALLCHLFLLPAWLISQLRPEAKTQATPAESSGAEENAPKTVPGVPVTITAREQERQGDVFTLRGDVQIDYGPYILRADLITYNSATGEATASGNVVFDGGPHDEHITASHGRYNINTDSGVFYDVAGSTGARLKGRNVVLTTSNPFMFNGREVEKVGRDKIIVRHGRVTSCKLPNPKWTFNAGEVVVVPGEDAKIYNSTFRFFGVPIFYLPYVQHPVERLPRQSGFLLPNIGQSNRMGFILGDAFYWAINRSMDATLGADYYSKRGWAQRAEFRARPNATSFINFSYFGVVDRGLPTTEYQYVPGVGVILVPAHQDQGGREARLNAEAQLPYGFRGVASIDYLSRYIFRFAFSERFTEAINSEAKSVAFASRTENGYSTNFMSSRYQNFQSTQPGDVITIVHAPGAELDSVERKLGSTPFHWWYDAALEGLSRREPNFVTGNPVGRFDLQPSIALPLHWKGVDFAPELSLRDTYYTERLLPSGTGIGTPSSNGINRRAVEATVDVRPPSLARVFERTFLNHKIKHVVEPRFQYHIVSGVDNFQNILRFDSRDILSDTNEIEYALVNRVYAKRQPIPNCQPASGSTIEYWRTDDSGCEAQPAREVVSWEIAQKYFFDPNFGGALVPGRRNVFTTTADFTGIAFLTEPRHFSPIISRLRVSATSNIDAEWMLDYDTQKGRISRSTALLYYKFLDVFNLAAGQAFLQTPGEVFVSQPIPVPQTFNQFRVQLNYGHPNRRGINIGGMAGYDVNQHYLQYSAAQASYNWDCCGVTFEYRRFNFGNQRDESQYRFALTLANIGTFGTLRKQERLF